MATTKAQRISIWIIAGVMTVGTIGSFAAVILANKNSSNDQAKLTALTSEYSTAYKAYTAEVTAISKKYYSTLKSYKTSQVSSFTKSDVTKLVTTDLVVGTGDTITSSSSYSALYFGWNPSGKVFDSSFSSTDTSALSAPLSVTSSSSLIKGWTQGVVGMKVGGIRELTIPSSLAYGSTAESSDIPADTPLKFVIMVIPESATEPTMPAALLKYYQTGSL